MAELKNVREFRAYDCCRCDLKQNRRQRSIVVFSDCLRGFERRATTKILAELALCCVILPPSFDSRIVVWRCRGNGHQLCATVCLSLWLIDVSPFPSRFWPC